MKPVVVFDLDDTLYPESAYVMSGFRVVDLWLQEQLDIEQFEKVAIELFTQGVRGTIFNDALALLDVPVNDGLIHQLVKVYRNHIPTIALYEDALEVLQLCQSKVCVGLITDGYLIAQQRKVAALQLLTYVDHIVFSDSYGRNYWKPHPLPYQTMMEHFYKQADRFYYIGDNISKDFITAKQLGWTTIHINRGNGQYDHLNSSDEQQSYDEPYQAHYKVQCLRQLEDIIFNEVSV